MDSLVSEMEPGLQQPLRMGRGSDSDSAPQSNHDGNNDSALRSNKDDDSDSGLLLHRDRQYLLRHVRLWPSDYPRSCYSGWQHGVREVSEPNLLEDFQLAYPSAATTSEYVFLALDDFSIYRPSHATRALELVSLDVLNNQTGCNELRFDGVLSHGSHRYYVKNRPFNTLTIEGYGDPTVFDLEDRLCIQSLHARTADIWYMLKRPSTEYTRFFLPFKWLAMFTKQFVDYLLETTAVTLDHFRNDFYNWILERYNHDDAAASWLRLAKLKDFRSTVAAHVGYLWKECYSINQHEAKDTVHPLWLEVDPARLNAIPRQPEIVLNTIVTPFLFHCFQHMPFAEFLDPSWVITDQVLRPANERKKSLGLVPDMLRSTITTTLPRPSYICHNGNSDFHVQAGDVVCVAADKSSRWRSISTIWYAYIQAVRGQGFLDVVWLYEPADTTISSAFYPFSNELFFSDNCGCGKDAIHMDSVIGKINVAWFVQDPYSTVGWFVRATFRTVHEDDLYDFVSLQAEDFVCACRTPANDLHDFAMKYGLLDFVLVKTTKNYLEPAQIIKMPTSLDDLVELKRFKRKQTWDNAADMNELIDPDELFGIKISKVVRKCQIRAFGSQKDVISPYDRNGAGDFFYMISKEPKPFVERHPPLPNPTPEFSQKQRGLGIFCGGGNLDRGLEEGGGVEFDYAVDIAEAAMHTYRANCSNKKAHFYNGSVNDYLASALSGSDDARIAKVNGVNCMAAGSPCPGFSLLTNSRTSEKAKRQASMIASVISFADLYSPEYMVLENVPSMASDGNYNVFAQIVATLVALGYQVQQVYLQSGNYGSCQKRPRLFIIASAPTRHPITLPPHTHSNPENESFRNGRLGIIANGLCFGRKRDDWTPFPHVSAAQAMKDLPLIGNGQILLCPQFPDHRVSMRQNDRDRRRTAAVPLVPEGMGLALAAKKGMLASGEPLSYARKLLSERENVIPKSFCRIRGSLLMPTITTSLTAHCRKSGRVLHWQEHRPMTIMEMRRGQGFPDHEVLIGTPTQQMTIVGNSVERHVAFALGLSLKESLQEGLRAHGRRLGVHPSVVIPV